MEELYEQILGRFAVAALVAAACGIALEVWWPYEKQSPLTRVRGLLFWFLFVTAVSIVVAGERAAMGFLGLAPWRLDLASLARSDNWALVVLGYSAILLPFIIYDFFYYWFHRLQHAVPLLWRFHRTHHAIEEMSAANSAHHVSEELFRVPFIVAPAIFLFQIDTMQILVLALLLGSWPQIAHSNTRIEFGPLRWLLISPVFHRVHHSLDLKHRDRNFAAFTPLWDVLFGTAYWPRTDEVIKTGLDDMREARGVTEYLLATAPRGD